MATELKPCPFCGGKASLVTAHNKNLTWIRYFVKCQRCLTTTDNYEKPEHAAEAWNRRAEYGR